MDNDNGPILLPQDKPHDVKLFELNSMDESIQIKIGDYIDSSKLRHPTNIHHFKSRTPFTGRSIEIHTLITDINKSSVRVINVCGPEGIGKTRFVVEAIDYMSSRYEF